MQGRDHLPVDQLISTCIIRNLFKSKIIYNLIKIFNLVKYYTSIIIKVWEESVAPSE